MSSKKKKRKPGALYFTDLCLLAKGEVAFIGHYYDLENSKDQRTAVPILFNDEWFSHDDVSGICYAIRSEVKSKRPLRLLARSGGLYKIYTSDNVKFENMAAIRNGFLMDLRKIGKHWYAVGGNHQILREEKSGWVAFDKGIYKPKGDAKLLLSIDGLSESDIYAVGNDGVMFHYNGKSWSKLSSPTKAGLQRVLCVDKNEVYICGHNGTLYKGSLNNWQPVIKPGKPEIFYDLTYFKNKVYACTKKSLFVIEKQRLLEIEIPTKGPFGFYRMESDKQALWTCGDECVLRFDGKKWSQYTWMDNE